MTRSPWPLLLPSLLVPVLFACGDSSGGSADGPATEVQVTRGTVVRQAVAVGNIEPEHEVGVKSLSGGLLTNLQVELGERVEKGQALAEVRPVVTPRTRLELERGLEAAQKAEEAAEEMLGGDTLAGVFMKGFQGAKSVKRMHEDAVRGREDAEKALRLFDEGIVTIDAYEVDFFVRSPIAGHVLELPVREGGPIVPRSSYGSGTVLATIGDMDRSVFRGTVDEIDVGRLAVGMETRVRVGALSGVELTGKLVEIALKSRVRNNAIVFDVRIEVETPDEVTLRSGYSATAEIEIARSENVLVLPERVVEFRASSAFVRARSPAGDIEEREITVGLSDGLTLEVQSGLVEGDRVLERAY